MALLVSCLVEIAFAQVDLLCPVYHFHLPSLIFFHIQTDFFLILRILFEALQTVRAIVCNNEHYFKCQRKVCDCKQSWQMAKNLVYFLLTFFLFTGVNKIPDIVLIFTTCTYPLSLFAQISNNLLIKRNNQCDFIMFLNSCLLEPTASTMLQLFQDTVQSQQGKLKPF